MVTGATGFIGRHLCRHLRAQGIRVIAQGRKEQAGPWDIFRTGDIAGVMPMNLFDGVDTVFHLAGIAHAMQLPANQQSIYQQVNVEGTQHLIELVKDSEVERFIYFSSIKAMGDPGDDCVDENLTTEPADQYGISKRKAEELVLTFGQETGRHVCCLRPTLVYGTGAKGNLERMINAIKRGRFPHLPDFHNKRSMVSVNDLIEAAQLAVTRQEANGEIFIVSDNEHYSTRRIYEAMCRSIGKQIKSWQLPAWPLPIVARIGDIIGKLRGRPAAFNSETWKRLSGSACYRSDKIRAKLGWQSRQTLDELMPEIIHSEHLEHVKSAAD
jgi:UDP-glucose 4-epimerase